MFIIPVDIRLVICSMPVTDFTRKKFLKNSKIPELLTKDLVHYMLSGWKPQDKRR